MLTLSAGALYILIQLNTDCGTAAKRQTYPRRKRRRLVSYFALVRLTPFGILWFF